MSTYDAEFYKNHQKRNVYKILAEFLHDVFKPKSAVDFGCGVGATLYALKGYGCEVMGLDGSQNGAESGLVSISVKNLADPIDLGRKYDLAISTEVGEHLDESKSDTFVKNIADHSGGVIFFTAAQPGQGGKGHVNCQPKEYWANKFLTCGFKRSWFLEFCAGVALYPTIWDAWWIRKNAQVMISGESYFWRAFLLLPKFAYRAFKWRFHVSVLRNKDYVGEY